MLAYVLLHVEVGKSGDVVAWLRRRRAVDEAYAIYGEYDVLAKVNVADNRSLDRLVMETLQRNPGVKGTRTFLAIESVPKRRRRARLPEPEAEAKPSRRRRAKADAPEAKTPRRRRAKAAAPEAETPRRGRRPRKARTIGEEPPPAL